METQTQQPIRGVSEKFRVQFKTLIESLSPEERNIMINTFFKKEDIDFYISKYTYEDLREFHKFCYPLGLNLDGDFGNQLKFFILAALLKKAFDKKAAKDNTPKKTVLEILKLFIKIDDDTYLGDMYKSYAIVLENMLLNSEIKETYNYTSAKDVVKDLKEIAETEIPF